MYFRYFNLFGKHFTQNEGKPKNIFNDNI